MEEEEAAVNDRTTHHRRDTPHTHHTDIAMISDQIRIANNRRNILSEVRARDQQPMRGGIVAL